MDARVKQLVNMIEDAQPVAVAVLAWIGNTYLDDSGRDSPASLNSTGDM